MRRTALVAAAVALVVPASAGAEGEDHNCAGAITSSVAGPALGPAVAAAAQAQVVDNFGFANCGETSGQNP